MLEKKKLRQTLLQQRRNMGRNMQMDAAITCALVGSSVWQTARSIFVYLPLAWEIDTRAMVSLAFEEGKKVAVPISGLAGEMKAVRIDAQTRLHPGRYGILEPETSDEIVSPQDTSLIIVPALAFARDGVRLGRGGGYYDRWLADTQGISVGLCYTQYLFPYLPSEGHDRRVDAICTQEGILWTKG